MSRYVACAKCHLRDREDGAVKSARFAGGLVLDPACRDERACLQRRLAASLAYSEAFRAVAEARR